MDSNLEYLRLVKSLTHCENLSELKEVVKEINEFLSKYMISQDSREYQKLEQVLHLMRVKLKRKFQNENHLKKLIRLVIKEHL
jgi:hypothetical protein